MTGEREKSHVYDRLFALGLEGSMVTTICPVAFSDQWPRCPFCKEG
jgi:hypothetical protein